MNLGASIEDVLCAMDRAGVELADGNDRERREAILSLVDKFSALAVAVNEADDQNIDLTEYNEKLGMLLSAFENQDYDLMANVLHIELKPLLEYWREVSAS